MDEVGVEIVGQRDIGDRGVRLSAFGDDLGLEGRGVGTAFLWHRRPLKRLKMVSVQIQVDTIASSDGFRRVCCPDGYLFQGGSKSRLLQIMRGRKPKQLPLCRVL